MLKFKKMKPAFAEDSDILKKERALSTGCCERKN